jgi:hypothetical protein
MERKVKGGNHENPPSGSDAVTDPWPYTEADVRNIATRGYECVCARLQPLGSDRHASGGWYNLAVIGPSIPYAAIAER